MRELSLFTGAGGGLLGTKLLGWTNCGYVEHDDYCQRVIRARIDDGILDDAPIFGDIRAFISDGYAASYQGLVDVVTGGFPCQPFSVAGKQQGADDSRNMWPETIAVLRAVRPRFAYLENVAGLLGHEYARRIFGDLAESGFDARWRVLSAAECGAPHKRDRVWIVADANGSRSASGGANRGVGREWQPVEEVISDANEAGCKQQWRSEPIRAQQSAVECDGETMADACDKERERGPDGFGWGGEGAGDDKEEPRCGGSKANDWWSTKPDVGRVADGVASRLVESGAVNQRRKPAMGY